MAFAHALRIALATRSKLHLLHISQHDTGGALAFPHARRLLAQWGLSEEDAPPWEIAAELGIEIHNSSVKWQQPAEGIVGFLRQHPCDLIVLATHGGDGFERWLRGSVSETVSRRSAIPTLFVAPGARGFVSQITGDIQLRRALVPVDFSPAPNKAIRAVQRMGRLLTGADIVLHILHVGRSAPSVRMRSSHWPPLPPVMLRHGNVVKSIVDAAIEFEVERDRHAHGRTSWRAGCAARQYDRARNPARAVPRLRPTRGLAARLQSERRGQPSAGGLCGARIFCCPSSRPCSRARGTCARGCRSSSHCCLQRPWCRPPFSHDVIAQLRLAAPDAVQILHQQVDDVVLVAPGLAGGVRRDQRIVERP